MAETRLIYLLLLLSVVSVSISIEYRCESGSRYVQGSNNCEPCPANTYWVPLVDTQGNATGFANCVDCPLYNTSPEGSSSYELCVCEDSRCKPKGSSMGLIVGIFVTVLVMGAVIGALFWCKTYGPEFYKSITGRHLVEAEQDVEGYDLLDNSPESNVVMDIDVKMDDVTDAQLDDNYNDITTKGDHNDMGAVLRAAVISEKRRSRIYSMSSQASLEHHRSMNSMSGRAGYEKAEAYNRESHLPLPSYDDMVRNGRRDNQMGQTRL